jgi:DNA modification methylase
VEKNKLYYGDNLEVLRQHVKDESVDLIYLDPPFNSRQDYNMLFAEKDGTRSSSQIMAFEDTWEWNVDDYLAPPPLSVGTSRSVWAAKEKNPQVGPNLHTRKGLRSTSRR